MMSDNVAAYVSRGFTKGCRTLEMGHIYTKPYTPGTVWKPERLNQSLCKEWAYGLGFQNSE